MEKCSRLRGNGVLSTLGMLRSGVLRGNQPPNPPGMPGGNVLRGNWGTFIDGSADDGGLRGIMVLRPSGGSCGIFLRGDGGCGDGVMG